MNLIASARYQQIKILVAIIISGLLTPGSAEISVTDITGVPLRLAVPARRIVSLAPHLTELLYAAGVGDYVIGVTAYSDYPPAARALPIVGGAGKIDMERILALRPDLLVAWESGGSKTQIERLRHFGLIIYVSESRTLTDIALEIEHLGKLAGTEITAGRAATTFLAHLAALKTRYAHQPPVRIFYQIWDHPLITVGASHLISRVMELCGGRNIFAAEHSLAPLINREAVLAANPEVIVTSGNSSWWADWRVWPQISAVAHNNFFDIPPYFIQRHTPRILQGAELLCAALEIARNKR